MTQVTKIRKNIMGTISFTAKFKGMRKEQEFIIYPNPEKRLRVQAKTKCGYVSSDGGAFISSCEYFFQIPWAKQNNDVIENIEELKEAVRNSASMNAGSSGFITCDNSKAGAI